MGLSSTSRRFKTLRRKHERLPIGTIIDNASYPQPSTNEPPPDAGHSSLGYGAPGYGPQDYSAQGYISPGHVVQNYPPEGYNSVGHNPQGVGSPGHASQRASGAHQPLSRSSSLSSAGPGLVAVPSDINSRMAMTGSAAQGDLVVFRLNSWITLVKQYSSYLEAFSAAQKTSKKALEKSAEVFDVPLKGEHCFLGVERNGVQRMSAHLKDVHQMYSTHYARLVQHIETNALDQLESLRSEIKDSLKEYVDHLGPIYKRLRKQAKEAEVYKQKLVRAVEAYKKKHRGQDAWLIQQQVRRELTKQAELENALCKAMQAEHTRLFRWESTLTGRLRDIIASTLMCERDSLQTTLGTIANGLWFLEKFDSAAESQAFNHHCGSVFRTPLGLSGNSTLADYDYMYRDSEPTTVLLEGPLERERGVLKRFQHTYAVLTAQGYLHCYADQRDLLERNPDGSFHLPDCSIRPLDDMCMFMVTVSDKKLGRSKYAFRSSDPSTTTHWINAISAVAAPPKSPEPLQQDQHVVGGTLRDSAAAMAAADAAKDAPNTLPTAAGIPAHELAARNAAEDAQSQERSLAAKDASSADKGSVASSASDESLANSEGPAKSPDGNKQADADNGSGAAGARALPAAAAAAAAATPKPASHVGSSKESTASGDATVQPKVLSNDAAMEKAKALAAARRAPASKGGEGLAKASPAISIKSTSTDESSIKAPASGKEPSRVNSVVAANRAKALATARNSIAGKNGEAPALARSNSSASSISSASSSDGENVVKALGAAGVNSSRPAEASGSNSAALRAKALAAARSAVTSTSGNAAISAPRRDSGSVSSGTGATTANTSPANNESKLGNEDASKPSAVAPSKPSATSVRMPTPGGPPPM
ncbi:hypothetical protein H4R24_002158 [Coemansia sp. RSA 988]|nr:hypothetical protein H4R24_002158 [Coemansia sp. RSA 988]